MGVLRSRLISQGDFGIHKQAKTKHKSLKTNNQEHRSAACIFILVSPIEKGEMSELKCLAVCSAKAVQHAIWVCQHFIL